LQHLIRVICASRPYQLACRQPTLARSASEGNVASTLSGGSLHELWSRYPMKQLEVEVLLETVLQATGSTEHLSALSTRNLDLIRTAFARLFVTQISNDDSSEVTNFDETIPRALLMLNGPLFCGTTRNTEGLALNSLYKKIADDRDRIDQLYLLTLSRLPSDKEVDRWQKFLSVENVVVSTKPATDNDMKVSGIAATMPSMRIATAPPDTDFSELIKNAQTGADFKILYSKMKNN